MLTHASCVTNNLNMYGMAMEASCPEPHSRHESSLLLVFKPMIGPRRVPHFTQIVAWTQRDGNTWASLKSCQTIGPLDVCCYSYLPYPTKWIRNSMLTIVDIWYINSIFILHHLPSNKLTHMAVIPRTSNKRFACTLIMRIRNHQVCFVSYRFSSQ